MTFRRIMLVVLPFLGAVFAFMFIRWLYRDWEASLLQSTGPLPGQATSAIPRGEQPMTVKGGMEHWETDNLNLVRKDRDGRMEMRFLADRVRHSAADTSDVERPRIQFFTRAGEIITLVADQGRIVTKGAVTDLANIESGLLWGHVVLAHDRGTPDDHSDDILAELDDLKFNNETYELATDGPVVMSGLEMGLTARKMRMALNRKTRRIDTMTFMQDIRVTLETGGRRLAGPQEPPAGSPTAAAAPGAAPAPAAPAPAAAAPPTAAPDDRGDLWRIDLAGNVDARQGDQRMTCDRISLYNNASKASAEPGAAGTAAPGAPGAPAVSGPAAGPKRSPAGRAGQPEGTAADRLMARGGAAPLVVSADGPLIITPVTPEERKALGEKRNLVDASGSPVVVEDGPTRIVGAVVQYNMRTGSGSVIGKESPILLEQPGRLHLTGGRLDFDRLQASAEVQGEGELKAVVQGSGVPGARPKRPAAEPAGAGPAAAESAAVEPPSTLEASWARGMRLDFFRLPADIQSGMGEIRRAAFHGQSVVTQQDSVLKGDELAIDFSEPRPGRGQTVERLVGHGDVSVKTAPADAQQPPAEAPKKPAKLTVGDIACQNLDVTFVPDAAGDTQPKQLKASGAVAINDPQGKIRAERLEVAFGPPAAGGSAEPQSFEAFGNVLVDRADLYASGDHVRRDLAKGTLLLEGRPARASRGQSRIVGVRIEFSQPEGVAVVRGAGELEIPATTDLRGRQRQQAEPLLVKWKNSMLFEDQRNFAQFDGAVTAATGTSSLASDRLWVYFADRPDKPATATAPAAPVKGAAAAGAGDVQQLFGRKALVRVLAEKAVRAVEQQLAPDKTLRYQLEMAGDNLTYVEENRKAYMRGPGQLRILSREKPRPGEAEAAGLAPDAVDWKGPAPDGYARTEVSWTESMAYDGATDRAYFKGKADALYAGRTAPGAGAGGTRGRPTDTRIRSADLQVVFSEKQPPAAGPGAGAPAAPPPDATPREDRMAVEKLVADGGVLLWVDDRRGTAQRLIYQRDPELIRLYRGPDDWARLWQQNEATQEFGEVVAGVITYEPATGRVDVVDQQSITLSPKPKPGAPPPAPAAKF